MRAMEVSAMRADHEPVEITLWCRDRFATRSPDRSSEFQKTTYRRMLGPTDESTTPRAEYERETEARVDEDGVEDMTWDSVCEITHAAALQALGRERKPDLLPWLRGRGTAKSEIDAALSALRRPCWEGRQLENAGAADHVDSMESNRRLLREATHT